MRLPKTLLILLLSFTSSLLLGQGGFTIEAYDVEVILLESGEIKVEENITVDFYEKRRGIFREIPYIYQANNDKKYKISIDEIHVRDYKFKVSNKGNNKEIRIGDANTYLTGIQNYEISYKVQGAIAQYDNTDEFFWNVIGAEWEVPIKKASYSVRFPYGWKNKITNFASSSGDQGSNQSIAIDTLTDNIIKNIQNFTLQPKQGVTVAFEIPKGLIPIEVRGASEMDNAPYVEDKTMDWISLIPAGLLALLFGQWRKNGRRVSDPEQVEDQYYPPQDMSPAQVGTFYDYKVNRRDIISLLPYWGDKGYIRMKHLEDDIYFEKISDLPIDEPEYAQTLYGELFSGGDHTLLSSFKEKMYRTMGTVATKIMQEVRDKELYDARASQLYHSGWMIGAFILSVISGLISIIVFQSIFVGIAFFLLAIFCIYIRLSQPKLTDKGYNIHQHLRGLHQFLKAPNSTKMDELLNDNPSYINQLFPYALAFGLDKEWESLFEKREYYAPEWYMYDAMYHSGGRPHFSTFTKDFGAHKIEKVFYSTPAPAPGSSSGGGFSGGGSVGGGFGGGGGGSW